MLERLQKVLAAAGLGSRRKCEEWIAAGRVAVNGKTVTRLGVKVDPERDRIEVDGRPVRIPPKNKKVYLMLHKPKGYLSSVSDPFGRKTVIDLVRDVEARVYPVGRLDADTEGLLLLTDDGDFAHLLTHPRYGVPKTYLATVRGVPHGSLLERLRRGIRLEDGVTAPAQVEYEDVDLERDEAVIRVTIREGRKRQVRRMFEAIGHPVERLVRVAIGPVRLGTLPVGRYRPLSEKEVKLLRMAASRTHKLHNSRDGS